MTRPDKITVLLLGFFAGSILQAACNPDCPDDLSEIPVGRYVETDAVLVDAELRVSDDGVDISYETPEGDVYHVSYTRKYPSD